MFDLNKLVTFLEPFYNSNLFGFNDSQVLLLGHTGAGKSTTVNYLLGEKFTIGDGGLAQPVKSFADLPAASADSLASVTSYPKAFSLPSSAKNRTRFSLCDCPGLSDNRGPEIQVGISFCLDAVLQKATDIRALAIVVDYASIMSERSESFRSLIASLAQVMRTPDRDSSSLFLILNRLNRGVTKNYFVKKLSDILSEEEAALERMIASQNNQDKISINDIDITQKIERTKKGIQILKGLIKNCETNVIFIDVFDEGESRDLLLGKFSATQPITKEALTFSSLEQSRRDFEEIVLHNLQEYDDGVKQAKTLSQEYLLLNKSLSEIETEITKLNSKFQELKSNPPTMKDPSLSSIHSQIADSESKRSATREVVKKLETQLAADRHERDNLDVSDRVYYKDLRSSYNIDGFFGDDTIYDYNDVPFLEISASGYSGEYKIKEYNRSGGVYRGKYKRGYWDSNYQYPTVRVYVEKRHLPTNRDRITQLRSTLIPNNESSLASNQREISRLGDVISQLSQKLRTAHEDNLLRHMQSVNQAERELTQATSRKESTTSRKNEVSSELSRLFKVRQLKIEQLKSFVTIVGYSELENKQLFFLSMLFILDWMDLKKKPLNNSSDTVPLILDSQVPQHIKNVESYLLERLNYYISLFETYTKDSTLVSTIETDIIAKQALINQYGAELSRIEAAPPSKRDSCYIADFSEITKIETILTPIRSRVKANNEKIAVYRKELSNLELTTPVFYQEITNKTDTQKRLGNDTVYLYKGIPFVEVRASDYTGKYKHKESDPAKGTYRGKYKRGFFDKNDLYPKVEVWVEKSKHPENQKKIANIRSNLIPPIETALKRDEDEVRKGDAQIKVLNQTIDSDLAQRLAEHNNTLERIRASKLKEEKFVSEGQKRKNELAVSMKETLSERENIRLELPPLLAKTTLSNFDNPKLLSMAKKFVGDLLSSMGIFSVKSAPAPLLKISAQPK